MTPPDPLHLIASIRGSFLDASWVYKNGSCFEFYKILRCVYPRAIPWTDIDHVWTEIEGKLYDIDGLRIEGSEGLINMFTDPRMLRRAHRWTDRSKWRVDAAKKAEETS